MDLFLTLLSNAYYARYFGAKRLRVIYCTGKFGQKMLKFIQELVTQDLATINHAYQLGVAAVVFALLNEPEHCNTVNEFYPLQIILFILGVSV